MGEEIGVAECVPEDRLGELYRKGKGVQLDLEQGFEWLMRAALLGDTEAMREVGQCLVVGEGVGQDPKQGLEWLLLAAREGDTDAPVLIGIAYEDGLGVTKDTKAALAWMYIANARPENRTDLRRQFIIQQISEMEAVLGRDGMLEAQSIAKTLLTENLEDTASTNR